MNLFKKKKILVTHSGRFHTDDAFACAALIIYLKRLGKSYKIIRTRDPRVIESGDFVFDVGGSYDPDKERFDHHQIEGSGKRDNGIPYAAFGLVWKKYGSILSRSEEVARLVDEKLVQPIDALDNGVQISNTVFEGINNYGLSDIVDCYLPHTKEISDYDKYFLKYVDFAIFILESEIKRANYKTESKELVRNYYENAEDKRIIVLEENVSWKDELRKYPEPLFAVMQNVDGNWSAVAVRESKESFKNRKDFPESWAGLEREKLVEVTGVSDAVFCHRNLFLAVAKSKEGVLKMAQLAIEK